VTILKPNTFALFTDMLSDNDAAALTIAKAITNSINESDGTLFHNLAIRVRLRLQVDLSVLIPGFILPLDAVGLGYIDGAYTGPLRLEGDPAVPDWSGPKP
jgi:hypothetical protein